MTKPSLPVAISLLAFLFLAGCGTEAKNFCPPEGCRPEIDRQRQAQCATPANGNFHEITVKLKNAVPANIGVELDGERRFDECTTPAQKAPFVTVTRASGNRLVVRVEHAKAYAQLPAKTSLKIINLQACTSRMAEEIFEAEDLALAFSKEKGLNICPERDVARVTVQQP